ncbi:hypothetical protein ACF0H5_012177 [Mactra antiquata]
MGTWSESETSCKTKQGKLAVLDNIELQRMFDRDVKSNQGEGIWVGRYVGYTPIVTTEGCYRNQTLTKKRTKPLVNNHLFTCLNECKDTLFIGMQGMVCYCIESIRPEIPTVSGMYCKSFCTGETTSNKGTRISTCGMPDPTVNTVSVYRKVNANGIRIDSSVPNVGECFGYNVRTKMIQPVDCNVPKLFSCKGNSCVGPPQACVLDSNIPGTWIQARDKCDENNAILLSLNLTTSGYFDRKPLMPDPIYWTALHRKEVVSWNYEKDSTVAEYSDRCYVAVKQPQGQWQLVVDWCKNKHRYACVQDLKPVTIPPATQPPVRRTTTQQPTTTESPTKPDITTTSFLPTINPNAQPVNVTSSALPVLFISMWQNLSLVITTIISLRFNYLFNYM